MSRHAWARRLLVATEPVQLQSAGELEQSFWNRIKDSADPAAVADTRPSEAQHRAAGCEGVLGVWNWSVTGKVEITAGHQLHWTPPPGSNAPPVIGTWSCASSSERRVELRWPTGFVDTLTLSSDGRTLSGRSTGGIPVMGARADR
jgi:hypothetical protein